MADIDWTSPWERNFREHMRTRRETLGWSQTEFARRLKSHQHIPFHQQTIQRVEAGERPIRLDEAFKIAAELGLRVETMIQAATVRSDLVYAVNKIQRETEQVEGYVEEMQGDWLDAYEELLAVFYELLEEIGEKPTREIRWTAAWLLKAKPVLDTFLEFGDITNQVTGTHRERDPEQPVTLAAFPTWLSDDYSADIWNGVADDDHPWTLSRLSPSELADYLVRED